MTPDWITNLKYVIARITLPRSFTTEVRPRQPVIVGRDETIGGNRLVPGSECHSQCLQGGNGFSGDRVHGVLAFFFLAAVMLCGWWWGIEGEGATTGR